MTFPTRLAGTLMHSSSLSICDNVCCTSIGSSSCVSSSMTPRASRTPRGAPLIVTTPVPLLSLEISIAVQCAPAALDGCAALPDDPADEVVRDGEADKGASVARAVADVLRLLALPRVGEQHVLHQLARAHAVLLEPQDHNLPPRRAAVAV
eukprot:CAMPEP_0182839804 /NCGR_PEP_ID=MMETSP0006_2-20121128/24067_1 /TAXON_ID=97485 /ORGANISM="Prymnesium parvum, Strain Texoma1" /LENGTH=150 /DNA_ID=CAMNT_0024968989 /DNA_START=488 /DNA_END=937 /DNA_ORIENTATION=+